MSQVKTLPITATRWFSLLLCAITAATITVFLSKIGFVQKAYSSLGAILNANPVLHYSSAFLAGIGIKLLLDKFYISHAKRSIGFNWRYPPVTMSVLFGVFFIVSYVYVTYSNEILAQLAAHAFVSFKFLSLSFLAAAATIIYQTKLYTKNPIFSVVLCAVSAFYLFSAISLVETEQAFWVFFCIAVAYLVMSVYLLCEQLKASSAESKVESKQEAELTLDSLENFRKWFKDDSTIKNTEQLEPDLQVYAKRITQRLRTGGDKNECGLRGAQHIALCGPFGCGKSSIVASIANKLANIPKPDEIWIHSDISTWGAASDSVAHVVLSHIIDDISQYIDMCAFRSLPKHYTEALKSGGGIFQFASTLLAGPVDIEESFQKLNAVLEETNHKLLITLQDVDRCTGDENEKRLNDIAALLDRLRNKDLSNINFIIAMGNDKPEDFEVISKATDYREDIEKIDFRKTLASFTRASIDEAKNNHSKIILYKYSNSHEKNKLDQVIAIIDSPRQLKKILRRVNQAWQPNKLMGEVNFYSLLMVIALRETNPVYFERYCKAESKIKKNKDDLDNLLREIAQLRKEDITEQQNEPNPNVIRSELIYNYLKAMLLKSDVTHIEDIAGKKLKLDSSKDHEQSVGCTHSDVDYLRRILLEKVPDGELSDQSVMAIIEAGEPGLIEFISKYLSLKNSAHEAQYSLFAVMRSKDKDSSIYVCEKNIPMSIGELNDQATCKIIQFIAYYLTLENVYEVFNQLFNTKDDSEKLKALVCYLGVEDFTGDLEALKNSPVGLLILKLLQISFNKLPVSTSSIPNEKDKLAIHLKLKDLDLLINEGVELSNAGCLQAQYDRINRFT
ncbi:hypothetical protein MTF66_31470 [Pseudoalteromonas sp. 2CM39R]|uniref:P-loop NTPase fold protein n=1 Tax=Pseudoalteromonas sp. 2CM39R TaxID=2929856 RepID=UPI0020BEEB70|nr:P-loop NTPase fold protein [Pseudoalteromonas sp. 2CM39R]MCK8129569.1 hypothetical protein [Pseudoalteromonas sp. 2CM39R]